MDYPDETDFATEEPAPQEEVAAEEPEDEVNEILEPVEGDGSVRDNVFPKDFVRDRDLCQFRANLQRSLLLIKPEAVQHQFKILARLKKEGFFVIQKRHVLLTPEQASEFFAENYGKGWFPRQVALTSRAPVLAVCVSKLDCINELNRVVGPHNVAEARRLFPATLRANFGNVRDDLRDAVHASANEEKAEFEIHFFFPNMVLEPLWTEERASDYFHERLHSELVVALAEVCKVKPVDPVLWLGRYLLLNDRAQPKQEERIATLKT